MTSIPCDHCTAACCRYVAVPLETPRRPRDYDDIRWYLMHQGISVFIEDGDWYIQFYARCNNLQSDHRCGVYPTRPVICRDYTPGECDYSGGAYGYEAVFHHPDQVDEYYRKKTGKILPSSQALAAGILKGRARAKKTG